jgi:hypothetical protein
MTAALRRCGSSDAFLPIDTGYDAHWNKFCAVVCMLLSIKKTGHEKVLAWKQAKTSQLGKRC